MKKIPTPAAIKEEQAAILSAVAAERPVDDKFAELARIADHCTMCSLSMNRTHAVFGEGPVTARAILIGEGPGETEDRTGRPFVGSAGRHLNRVLIKVGLDRRDLYITNVVKCHHRGQKPTRGQMAACSPYLNSQIQQIQPRLLILCGSSPLQGLLGPSYKITKMHGTWLKTPYPGIDAMAVYHPSYLMYRESLSEDTPLWQEWENDWRKIKQALDALRGERPPRPDRWE